MAYQQQYPDLRQQQDPLALLPQHLLWDLSPMARAQVATMRPDQVAIFQSEFSRQRKSSGTAYLLWFLFGAHYLYLERWSTWLLYVVTGAGCGIWAIVDLFRLSGEVQRKNSDIALEVIARMRALGQA